MDSKKWFLWGWPEAQEHLSRVALWPRFLCWLLGHKVVMIGSGDYLSRNFQGRWCERCHLPVGLCE